MYEAPMTDKPEVAVGDHTSLTWWQQLENNVITGLKWKRILLKCLLQELYIGILHTQSTCQQQHQSFIDLMIRSPSEVV